MKVNRLANGDIEMMLTGKELYTIRQCLNEVCNGFRVPDFKSRIGVDESAAIELLDETRISSHKKVANLSEDLFRLSVARDECRVLVNSMKETFREGRGEGIPLREYRTRVGASVEEIKALISQIEVALAQ
jgi:hypothetical protein